MMKINDRGYSLTKKQEAIGKSFTKHTARDHLYWAEIAISEDIQEYDEAINHLNSAIELIKNLKKSRR